MTRLPALALALIAAMGGFAAHAQKKDTHGGTPTDAYFFKNAGHSGLAEVELSKLAVQRAGSPKVKAFAQKMVEEHTRVNEELEGLKGGDKTYPRATQLPPEADKQLDALERMNGTDFDKAYMKIMVADHEEAVAQFSAEIEKGSNEEMKAFARKTLPVLKRHLEMARSLP
jgi:putative membrane protein